MKSFAGALSLALLTAVPALAGPAPVPSSDTVTVGTVSLASAGSTVDVPVYIRDASGTPLGIDQPPGSRIQSYSLTVNYAPASAVQSVTFTRAGITAPLTPAFESSPSAPGTISLLDVFQESTNLIPFTLNGAPPGNQVGVLHLTIAPTATVGTTIALTLDPMLTQLANQAGTTSEATTNGSLTLVKRAIVVPAPVPALAP